MLGGTSLSGGTCIQGVIVEVPIKSLPLMRKVSPQVTEGEISRLAAAVATFALRYTVSAVKMCKIMVFATCYFQKKMYNSIIRKLTYQLLFGG